MPYDFESKELQETYRIYNLGEDGSGLKPRGPVQDYEKIKKSLLKSKKLWKDSNFKTDDSSLFITKSSSSDGHKMLWKRPSEIIDDPKFDEDGFSRFDVIQGTLGNCWAIAGIANLVVNKKMFHLVVPEGQSFDKDYCGIFRFRFWQYGKWIEVVVDDYLPCIDDFGELKLYYMHSKSNNEFWSALLEKAYAKLYGSYESINGGIVTEAMEDFTGGLSESWDMWKKDYPPKLFEMMKAAHQMGSMLGTSIDANPGEVEMELDTGLFKGHAYSITDVKKCPTENGEVQLVRIRNPWGKDEWNGPWSDGSKEWKTVSKRDKEKLNLITEENGEFYMSFDDFVTNFQQMEFVHKLPNRKSHEKLRWEVSEIHSRWVKNLSAGGCLNNETFYLNPQYQVTLTNPDNKTDKCTLLVGLMQKNSRTNRAKGKEKLSIGFCIYEIKEDSPKPLDKEFFAKHYYIGNSGVFMNARERSKRFHLKPGKYVIIPSCFENTEEGDFFLRIFTEEPHEVESYENKVGSTVEQMYSDKDKKTYGGQIKDEEVERTVIEGTHDDTTEIGWKDLSSFLDRTLQNELGWEGLSENSARLLVAMVDAGNSGKIEAEEFKRLTFYLKRWIIAFKMHDYDKTGCISPRELSSALRAVGISANKHLLGSIVRRYGDMRTGGITMGKFLTISGKLVSQVECFRDADADDNGEVTLTLTQFIENAMYY